MLFSRKNIAEFINSRFESAWQSVRPSALVRIDFGNGKTITRTLNGNIATYICLPDGRVLDVIPGVYDPAAYLDRLQESLKLVSWAARQRRGADSAVRSYHNQQAESLRKNREAKRIVLTPVRSIIGLQYDMKLVLRSSLRGKSAGKVASDVRKTGAYSLPESLSSRVGKLKPAMLKKDSDYNETVRRVKVHDYLAKNGLVKPTVMTKWLYKNVLDTDLDDPYLGLGKVLFSSYPFAAEDK